MTLSNCNIYIYGEINMKASLSSSKYENMDIKDISLQELLFLSINFELQKASQELETLARKLFRQ